MKFVHLVVESGGRGDIRQKQGKAYRRTFHHVYYGVLDASLLYKLVVVSKYSWG